MAWLVVITGACGSGKSTVRCALADKEKADFVDGDWHHSTENVKKMSTGQPLSDQDRLPWLDTLHGVLYEWAHQTAERRRTVSGVLACSGLKRSYRDMLTGRGLHRRDISERCVLVQLMASPDILSRRLTERSHHFMSTSLISTQLAILEPLEPSEWPCVTCQATESVENIIENIQQFISNLMP